LKKLTPRKFGGQMIEEVTKTRTALAEIPWRLEGGTMPMAEVAGLGAAIEFLQKIGWSKLQARERELCNYALNWLKKIPGLRLLGPATTQNRLPVFSFVLDGVPDHDIATLLDESGIAVRSGHHCAQILHRALGVPSSARASLNFYNTREEIDTFAIKLKKINLLFHG